MNSAELILSASGALVSAIALAISIYTYRGSLRSAARPVLIFSARTDCLWQVQNIGSGPALTLTIADEDFNGRLTDVTTYYPLAAGATATLPWLRSSSRLLAAYTDMYGNTFTTICADNENRVAAGNKFPDVAPVSSEWLYRWSERAARKSRVTDNDLSGHTSFQLDVLRNEPIAKLGYIFRRSDLDEYFRRQQWYTPATADLTVIRRRLSDEDRATMNFIKAYQLRHRLETPTTTK